MSFQDVAKRVRAEANARGIDASMTKLNDAIALACYGKKYTAVIAADKSGKLSSIPSPPPHINIAARRYRLDEHAFGLSLHAGIEGVEPSGHARDAIVTAMQWLAARHEKELERLHDEELFQLADEDLVKKVLSHPELQDFAYMGFAEWIVAEGHLKVGGKVYHAHDLLLQSKSRPAWNSRERAYIVALTQAPLRLYLVEKVTPGYDITLRPIGAEGGKLIKVVERSGSDPTLVGTYIGGRVISHREHLELAGGFFQFSRLAGLRAAEIVRPISDAVVMSRTVRSAWFDQFDLPAPKVVLAGSGEPLRLITDTYACSALEKLGARLAAEANVEGGEEFGWSLLFKGDDDSERQACSISVDDDLPGHIKVFYESEARAEKYRPWFETMAADTATFIQRESIDPLEAIKAEGLAGRAAHEPRISPDDKSSILASAYTQLYSDFPDRPLPLLDGMTPRQVLRQPNGEKRVRELLAFYESNERNMAHRDRREPVAFDFLYRSLGLELEPMPVMTRGVGMYPDQFEINEAWVAFKMFDEPLTLKEGGSVEGVGLMDVGSTCVLNYQLRPVGTDFSEVEARGFLRNLKVQAAVRPPRKLFISSDVKASGLQAEAAKLGIQVIDAEVVALQGIVGPLKEQFSDRFEEMFQTGP